MLVTSYEGLSKNLQSIKKKRFVYFIIDEAHKIKNDQTRFSDESRQVLSAHRLLLTGTPLSNNSAELWSLLNFIMPNVFDTKDLFDQLFSKKPREDTENEIPREELVQAIHRIISPFMLRRLKHDTTIKLIPKKEIHIYCPMSALQKTCYKRLFFEKGRGDKIAMNNLIVQLRKASIHPYLFQEYWPEGEPITKDIVRHSGKFVVLDKMLDKFVVREKSKLLIFSQFTSVLDVLQDYLSFKGMAAYRLDGGTPVNDRNKYMEQFNDEHNETRVFILSTRAGGLGINLTAAHIVIMMDSDWNPQMDLQAMDRVHRMGQLKDVYVYRLVTRDSVEEKIIERQVVKMKIDFLLLEKGRHKKKQGEDYKFSLNKLADEELKDLAYFGVSNVLKVGDDDDLEGLDLEKMLEEGEKNLENIQRVMENKVREFGEKALEFKFENNYRAFLEMNGKDECLKALSYDQLQAAFRDGEMRKEERRVMERYLENMKYFLDNVPLPEAFHFYQDPVQLVYLRAMKFRMNYVLQNRLKMKSEYKMTQSQEEELDRLEASGFGHWSYNDFANFVHYSGKYGRLEIESINNHIITKSAEEVFRYACRFWSRANELEEGLEIINSIEWGEYKLFKKREIARLVSKDLEDCPHFTSIVFSSEIERNLKSSGRDDYSPLFDKFILFEVSRRGENAWESITEDVKKEPMLVHDWYACTRESSDIRKRYDLVLRKYSDQFEFKLKRPVLSCEISPYDFRGEYMKKMRGSSMGEEESRCL